MRAAQPKKLLIVNILDILRTEYSFRMPEDRADKLAAGLERALAIYRGKIDKE